MTLFSVGRVVQSGVTMTLFLPVLWSNQFLDLDTNVTMNNE